MHRPNAPTSRLFAALAVIYGSWAVGVGFAPRAFGADDDIQLERLEDVPGDRSVSDEGNSLEVGSVSDKPAPKSAAAPKPPPPPAKAPPPPPPAPSAAESIADAPPPRPEPPAEIPASARAENSPELTYDEFGEPKKKRRSEGFESPFFGGIDLQVGFPVFNAYAIEGNQQRLDRSSTAIRVGFEWIPLRNIGKLGVGAAAGFFFIKYPLGPEDTVDVMGFSGEASLIYRFEYLRHQVLVPYLRGGLQNTLVKQTTASEGADSTDWTGSPGFTYALGLALNLRPFGKKDAVRLDYNYGINDTYFTFEYVVMKSFDEATGPNLNSYAFRGGLRFEY